MLIFTPQTGALCNLKEVKLSKAPQHTQKDSILPFHALLTGMEIFQEHVIIKRKQF
jgi:hypothetical protein